MGNIYKNDHILKYTKAGACVGSLGTWDRGRDQGHQEWGSFLKCGDERAALASLL